ncbi:MAG: DUF4193 domain-containing protein [Micrococcales bacterium]|nr:DUF4193 domain-containing protein [Micrococcales bacterium]NBR61361.1 DUF4193 domain-containing protein [Actinomycetota bacterium]NBR54605.1 DUF4193 domain-containing protein [Micrococcales bacterium]NBT46743.1 DUF4193 domain-containing protein [Actinomycetota bacterium]NBY43815.1 DUF4193 domain-containing protein [Micrococcales bacterium]
MATDYDAPRKNDDDTESIEVLKERVPEAASASADLDVEDHHDSFTIPEVTSEEAEVIVVPKQEDEFTCSECFIVKHHSQKARKDGKYGPVCVDCSH